MTTQPPEELLIIEFKDITEDEDDHMHCGSCYPTDKGQIVITLCGALSRDVGKTARTVTCEGCMAVDACSKCGYIFYR